jgi:hypothetical protein
MCRWHKHVAKIVATDPVTGEFNVGFYAVGLTAMALFRIEQKRFNMPELFSIDGFNPREILTEKAVNSYERSGLKKSADEAEIIIESMCQKIRSGLIETNKIFQLNKEYLSLPDIVTKDGYKKTCCSVANPRENGPFLDAAVVYLFKGYNDINRSIAEKSLQLISSDELAALVEDHSIPERVLPYIQMLESIRLATEIFLKQPDMMEFLENAFVGSIVYIFETAESDLQNNLGIDGHSNCIMCEGNKGRNSQFRLT